MAAFSKSESYFRFIKFVLNFIHVLLFYLSSIEKFDHEFFNINELEAKRMDPQHKIALEVSYRALEDAGLTLDDVTSSNTAVYMGEVPEDVDVILCVTSLHCRDTCRCYELRLLESCNDGP